MIEVAYSLKRLCVQYDMIANACQCCFRAFVDYEVSMSLCVLKSNKSMGKGDTEGVTRRAPAHLTIVCLLRVRGDKREGEADFVF